MLTRGLVNQSTPPVDSSIHYTGGKICWICDRDSAEGVKQLAEVKKLGIAVGGIPNGFSVCHLYHLNIVDTVQESFMNTLQETLRLQGSIAGQIGYTNVNAVNWCIDKPIYIYIYNRYFFCINYLSSFHR